jgi:DNA-binding NarL/FixJ family response regulator
MKTIQILLVDDHQVVRDGLQRMLEQEEDLEVVGQSSNSDETLSRVDELAPDIVLMDIKMPGMDGIELTRQVKRRHPSCNIIMLTLYDQYLNQAMEAGARGYLLKDIKRRELAQAIRQVFYGQMVTSESFKQRMNTEYDERRRYMFGERPANTPENLQAAPLPVSDIRPAPNPIEPAAQVRNYEVRSPEFRSSEIRSSEVKSQTAEIRSQPVSQTTRQTHEPVAVAENIKTAVKVAEAPAPVENVSLFLVDELQVALPPQVEASQLMRLADRIEESLHSRVLKMIGAWQEGTVMCVVLTNALPLGDILKTLKNMPEVENAGLNPVNDSIDRALLAKADAIPRLKDGVRKTVYLSLEKGQVVG